MLMLCLSAIGCGREPAGQVQSAFYHWQTHLQLTEPERHYLDSLGVKKLYVKFFDIDWDEESGQPVPHASVEIDTTSLKGLEIVPTVFITNRTFLNLSMEEVPFLSNRIFEKLTALYQPLQTDRPYPSVQFDCDWTPKTKDKFFALLESFRKTTEKTTPCSISATIRLHQLKFFEKTGVPPVDRGMLMFYNMGDLEAWDTQNSILDLETAKQYLPRRSSALPRYPLPLDLALPVFRWGVLFRDGRLIKLINHLGEEDLQDSLRFTKIAPHRFEVKKSTYLQGYYLYERDQLRLEGVEAAQLEAVAALWAFGRFSNFEKSDTATVAFFYLDTATIKMFPASALGKVLGGFHW